MRTIRRLPPEQLKEFVKAKVADSGHTFTDEDFESFVRTSKRDLEDDPFALFDPPADNAEDAQAYLTKAFARETGLYVATMTGAIVYTDSDTQWRRLHGTDGVREFTSNPASAELRRELDAIRLHVPMSGYVHDREPAGAARTRDLLRELIASVRNGRPTNSASHEHAPNEEPQDSDDLIPLALSSSIPVGGFRRTDVSRLVLTFGRTDDVDPVCLGLFLRRP